MKILKVVKDGGPESRVWAYFLIELKRLFSIALLRFEAAGRRHNADADAPDHRAARAHHPAPVACPCIAHGTTRHDRHPGR